MHCSVEKPWGKELRAPPPHSLWGTESCQHQANELGGGPSPGKLPEDRSPSHHLDLQSMRDLQWKSPVWSCQDSWPTEIFDAYYLKMLSLGWIAMQQLITNTQDASLSSLHSILIGILICTYRQPCTIDISQIKGWSSEKRSDVSGRLGHRAGKYRARRQIQVCLTYQKQMLFPLNKTALKCS